MPPHWAALLAATITVSCGTTYRPFAAAPRDERLFYTVAIQDKVPAALDVVSLGGDGHTRLVGVYGETFAFVRDGRLFARSLPNGMPRDIGGDSERFPVLGGDADSLYGVTPDCSVTDESTTPLHVLWQFEACPGDPSRVLVDATHVYVLFNHGGDPLKPDISPETQVWSVDRAGGRAERIADFPENVREQPLQDEESLYVVPSATRILQLPKRGGEPTLFAEGAPSDRPGPLVHLVDDGYVYWRNGKELVRTSTHGGDTTIVREPDTYFLGLNLTSLAVDATHFYAAVGDRVYAAPRPRTGGWLKVAELPHGYGWALHVISGQLYAFDRLGRSMLVRVDLAGPRARRLLDRDQHFLIRSLAASGSGLYFVAPGTGGDAIWTLPKAGGEPTQLLVALRSLASALTLDTESAYFLVSDGSLLRASLHGGSTQVLSQQTVKPDSLLEEAEPLLHVVATDATNVYWLDYSNGTVRKVSKEGGPTQLLADGLHFPQWYSPFENQRLVVAGDSLYFVRVLGDTLELVRLSTGGGTVETLLRVGPGGEPRLGTTANRVFATNERQAYEASPTGLRGLGDLWLPGTGARAACGFTPTEDAIFYSPCSWDEHPETVVRRSSTDGSLRIAAIGLEVLHLAEFVADSSDVYFVEIGQVVKKGPTSRPGCCSIWAVPR
jgi:hypothetical protein